jgi:hypothetical protein
MTGAHISLVFREMWDSANLNGFVYGAQNWGFSGRGIPHLAKNERDTRIFLYAAPTNGHVCGFH